MLYITVVYFSIHNKKKKAAKAGERTSCEAQSCFDSNFLKSLFSPHMKCKATQSFMNIASCSRFAWVWSFYYAVCLCFLGGKRDLQKNEISWTIEDMNGPFSALDKLKRL